MKVLCLEVLWWLVDGDPRVQRVLFDNARRDLKGDAGPDLALAALQTVQRLPRCYVLPLFATSDVEKTMCTLMGPTSLPSLRVAATAVLGERIFDAWILAEDCVVTSAPLFSFAELKRKRQDVQDRVRHRVLTGWRGRASWVAGVGCAWRVGLPLLAPLTWW